MSHAESTLVIIWLTVLQFCQLPLNKKKHCAVIQHNAFNFYSQLPDLNRFLQSRTSCALPADACVTTTVTYKTVSYLRHGWRLRLNFRKKCIAFLGRDTRSRSLILPLVGAHSGIRFYDILSCQEMSATFLAVNCRLRRPWRHLTDDFTILSVFVFNDFFQFFSQLPDLNRFLQSRTSCALLADACVRFRRRPVALSSRWSALTPVLGSRGKLLRRNVFAISAIVSLRFQ